MSKTRSIVALFALGVAALAIGSCGREGAAQAPRPQSVIFSRAPLAGDIAAIEASGISVRTTEPVDFATGRAVFARGASTGWHEHPGPGFVQVQSGSLTMITSDCSKRTFRQGEAFVDRPGEPLLSRNDGDKDTVLYLTFILPRGGVLSSPRKAPAGCAES